MSIFITVIYCQLFHLLLAVSKNYCQLLSTTVDYCRLLSTISIKTTMSITVMLSNNCQRQSSIVNKCNLFLTLLVPNNFVIVTFRNKTLLCMGAQNIAEQVLFKSLLHTIWQSLRTSRDYEAIHIGNINIHAYIYTYTHTYIRIYIHTCIQHMSIHTHITFIRIRRFNFTCASASLME